MKRGVLGIRGETCLVIEAPGGVTWLSGGYNRERIMVRMLRARRGVLGIKGEPRLVTEAPGMGHLAVWRL